MADRPVPFSERPVLAGLAALLSVAVVVGLLAGAVVLTGSKILGVSTVEGGGASSADGPAPGDTLYLPEPVKTSAPSGPRITLNVDPEDQSEEESEEAAEEDEKKKKKEKKELRLEAAQSEVPTMGRIDLSGSYPDGEGAILRVQRKVGGQWSDFPVEASVRGGTFSTYVVTGQPGKTKFRVVDTDSDKKSNAVTVTVG